MPAVAASAAMTTPAATRLPRLLVFDLDACLWTPEIDHEDKNLNSNFGGGLVGAPLVGGGTSGTAPTSARLALRMCTSESVRMLHGRSDDCRHRCGEM